MTGPIPYDGFRAVARQAHGRGQVTGAGIVPSRGPKPPRRYPRTHARDGHPMSAPTPYERFRVLASEAFRLGPVYRRIGSDGSARSEERNPSGPTGAGNATPCKARNPVRSFGRSRPSPKAGSCRPPALFLSLERLGGEEPELGGADRRLGAVGDTQLG